MKLQNIVYVLTVGGAAIFLIRNLPRYKVVLLLLRMKV